MEIQLICDTTEYESKNIDDYNFKTCFYFYENCMVISFCDKNDNVMHQSEIEIKDAKKLGQILNLL